MKQAEWTRITKMALPDADGWARQGKLIYRPPSGYVLTGLEGEDSSFDKGVYIWSLKVPLFVPQEFRNVGYSKRIGRGKFAADAEEEIIDALRAHQNDNADQHALLEEFANLPFHPRTRTDAEVSAYANLLLGDVTRGRAHLEHVLAGTADEDIREDSMMNCLVVAQALDRGGLPAAKAQLDEWCRFTANALKIEFRPEP